MLNDQETFSFELNELLYFNKGQEIVEMIGISLNPEISVQPFNDYVSIRGVIELKGEYVKATDSVEDDHVDLEDYHFRRHLETIEVLEPDRAIFAHRFPVEISVPAHRVDNIDDIMVSIEAFDYKIPSRQELKLTSTIEIHGVSEHIVEEQKTRAENKQESFTDEPFNFEVKKEKEAQDTDIEEPLYELVEEPNKLELMDENVIDHSVLSEEQNDSDEAERWKYKESQTLTEFFEEKATKQEVKETEDESIKALDEEEEIIEEASTNSVEDLEVTDEEIVLSAEDEFSSTEGGEDKDSVIVEVEDVSYLSDMFRGDEEQSSTQMRVRIVQPDDTIESIAEKYNLSTLQLINKNRLEDDHIEVGQLLHIPQKQQVN